MKTVIALLVILGTTQAWSCEEIKGKYNCGGNKISFYYETRADGVKLLTGSGETMIMDGQPHDLGMGMIYQVHCTPKVLQIDMDNNGMIATQKFMYRDARTLDAEVTLDGATRLLVCRK